MGTVPAIYAAKKEKPIGGHKSHTYIKIFTQRGTVPKPDQTVNRHPLNAYVMIRLLFFIPGSLKGPEYLFNTDIVVTTENQPGVITQF